MNSGRMNAIRDLYRQLDDIKNQLEDYAAQERRDERDAARQLGGIDADLPDTTNSDAMSDAAMAIEKALDVMGIF